MYLSAFPFSMEISNCEAQGFVCVHLSLSRKGRYGMTSEIYLNFDDFVLFLSTGSQFDDYWTKGWTGFSSTINQRLQNTRAEKKTIIVNGKQLCLLGEETFMRFLRFGGTVPSTSDWSGFKTQQQSLDASFHDRKVRLYSRQVCLDG